MIDTEQFYETPNYLAYKMTRYIPEDAKTILEPSAGSGKFLRMLKDRYRLNLYYCEINEIRANTCKHYSRYGFLGSDFLTADINKRFDCIIMNPPFNKAEEHFFKAYELLEAGGTMICLVSSETLDGKTQKERDMIKVLESEDANIELIEGAFNQKDCKRKTDVTCKLIVFRKNGEKENFSFSEGTKTIKNDLSLFNRDENTSVERYDYLKSMVKNYELAKVEYYEASKALDKLRAVMPVSIDETPHITSHSSFVSAMRSECWKTVFTMSKLSDYLTSDESKKFMSAQASQEAIEFNMENIGQLLLNMMNSVDDICKRSAESIFKLMTRYHSKNLLRHSWKTNSSYKINRKIILPDVLEHPWRAGVCPDSISYTSREKLADIEKTLCLMLGMKLSDISSDHSSTVSKSLSHPIQDKDFGTWHDSYFFKVKVFKKRTMHLWFKNEDILNKLNLLGSGAAMNIGEGNF